MNISFKLIQSLFVAFLTFLPITCFANDGSLNLLMTNSMWGILAIVIFSLAYLLVMAEEMTHIRKSKPVLLAAGIIWALVAYAAKTKHLSHDANLAVQHNILEYGQLFLFLLVAMTYVNAMQERQVFEALRGWLIKRQFSYRALFWITGILTFFISAFADNLTAALVMCAVILAVGVNQRRFIALSCINIVVAANAGGAFCPFGDITTLMVWQKGVLSFFQFFQLFVPSVVNFAIPALIMHFSIPKGTPDPIQKQATLAYGGKTIIILFLLTIVTSVSFYNFLDLPPAIGMMTGLAYLQFFGAYLKRTGHTLKQEGVIGDVMAFDIFKKIQNLEWDTLLFFYGIILCVGGLATFGYLELLSSSIYGWSLGLNEAYAQTPANTMVGLISALIDNIPVMYAILTMNPIMSEGQWLLVTLTAGVGGSMLSIGSAAGVALMGQAKGAYTFTSHLKWTWAILLGYIASIAVHLWWNASLFTVPAGVVG